MTNKQVMRVGDHVRQGDVLMVKVADVTSTPKPVVQKEKVILAHGEFTGHHHRFEPDSGVKFAETDYYAGGQTIEVTKPAPLVHEEHDAIMFTEGRFVRGFQVEDYGPEQKIRQVQD